MTEFISIRGARENNLKDVSTGTVMRDWRLAKVWLLREPQNGQKT